MNHGTRKEEVIETTTAVAEIRLFIISTLNVVKQYVLYRFCGLKSVAGGHLVPDREGISSADRVTFIHR